MNFYFGLTGAECERAVHQLMYRIGLPPHYAGRRPPELSGGEKQRVCIARALAARPDLIICDEVTSALDPLIARDMLALLAELQSERGIAYLFITHDLEVVQAIADHVVIMQRGRIVEQGPRQQILSPPHEPHTELLLSSVPQMDPDWLSRITSHRQALARVADGDGR